MKKTIVYCWKTLQLSWEANHWYAVLSVFGKIYESTLYPFFQVLILARVLDMLASGKSLVFSDFIPATTFFVISSLLRMLITSFLDTQQVLLEIRMDNYLDLQIDRKLTQLDPATFENPDFQNLLAQMEGVKGTLNVNIMRITAFLDSVFKLATASIVLMTAFPLFVPIMLVATIPSFFAMDFYRKKVWKYFVEERSLLVRVTQYVKNLLSQDSTSKEVSIYKTGDALYGKVKSHQKSYMGKFTRASESGLLPIILTRLIQFAAFAFTQALNLKAVIEGVLGIGQFTLYFQQANNLRLSAEGILDNYSSINMRNKYIEKYFEFMGIKRIISSPTKSVPITSSPLPPVIEFKNISFKYPNTKRYILKDFNLTIASGEKVALVGENGAGKSTLIKLLLRFYDASEGEVLINGTNIKHINLEKTVSISRSVIPGIYQVSVHFQGKCVFW